MKAYDKCTELSYLICGSQRCLGLSPIQKQTKNFKKLVEEKLSKNGVSQYVYKVWSSSFERSSKNKTFVDLAFCMT